MTLVFDKNGRGVPWVAPQNDTDVGASYHVARKHLHFAWAGGGVG